MAFEVDDPTTIRRFTVDEVLRMAEVGIIRDEERLELVDGVLVAMSPEGMPHAETVTELTGVFGQAYPFPEFDLRVQTTSPLTNIRYRVPDLLVCRRVRGRWPDGPDVLLVVEIAETSLRTDLGAKAAEYAEWGAETYWVVDLVTRRLVVHSQIGDARYTSTESRTSGEEPLLHTQRTVAVDRLFPVQ
jgi:Uma2 family endonuclease